MRGDRLKQERERRGLSQQELADRARSSQSQIWKYENGTSDPTGDVLARMARELECSVDYLLGLVDDRQGHVKVKDLSPEESELLAAYRRGDLSEALLILSQKVKRDDR